MRSVDRNLTALDRDVKVLWVNFKKHPAKEDPKAFLVYTLVDE